MQRYGELKHLITSFNQTIFGCGFYFFWNYEQPRGMKDNISTKKSGSTLVIESTFDAWYSSSFIVYIKNCREHNLPKDYYIPDHWKKFAFELESVVFATEEDNEDDNFVKHFLLKLNYNTSNEKDFYLIEAQRFYFEKLD